MEKIISEYAEFKEPNITSEARAKYIKNKRDRFYFRTAIGFLKDHNGYRPKNLHLFIGPAGSGKSSLLFSQIFDLIRENGQVYGEGAKIGLYLSEEKLERFETSLVSMGLFGPNSKITNCIKVFSEKDFKQKNKLTKLHYMEIVNILRNMLTNERINILFIDNITTGQANSIVGRRV